ncbi:hypothetical protein DNTS_007828, partial [Danionella cerebrum]
ISQNDLHFQVYLVEAIVEWNKSQTAGVQQTTPLHRFANTLSQKLLGCKLVEDHSGSAEYTDLRAPQFLEFSIKPPQHVQQQPTLLQTIPSGIQTSQTDPIRKVDEIVALWEKLSDNDKSAEDAETLCADGVNRYNSREQRQEQLVLHQWMNAMKAAEPLLPLTSCNTEAFQRGQAEDVVQV